MNEKPQVCVLGGDQRQIYMARQLAKDGYATRVWGLGACSDAVFPAATVSDWKDALRGTQAVILPLPASADGVRIHCPLQSSDVFLRITALFNEMNDRILLGGKLSAAMCDIAEQKKIRYIDYFSSEVLQLKNALPTAEGAIAIAMRELPVTIFGTSVLILGYGRIGSLLAQKLQALGAYVTVSARKKEQLVQAELQGYKTVSLVCCNDQTQPREIPLDCRVIFNTVPHRIFDKKLLSQLPKNCILIDLASPPGGIDHIAATDLGLRSIWATALPGKCTPETAGITLAKALEDMINELL